MFQLPSIVPGMQISKISRSSPANVPSAVKKKKYFRMSLIARTTAAAAVNPSTLPLARLRAKEKVSRPDNSNVPSIFNLWIRRDLRLATTGVCGPGFER